MENHAGQQRCHHAEGGTDGEGGRGRGVWGVRVVCVIGLQEVVYEAERVGDVGCGLVWLSGRGL